MRLAYYRGLLANACSARKKGAMMSVGVSESAIRPFLEELSLRFQHKSICVACINSPRSITVSGDPDQIDVLKTILDEQQIFVRKLRVDVAYHSPHMLEIAAEYLAQIKDLEPGESLLYGPVMISSVTGEKIAGRDLGQGEYWVQNLISPVNFSQALAKLCEPQTNTRKKLDLSHLKTTRMHDLVEIEPHSALQRPVRDILKETNSTEIGYHSLLVRKDSALSTVLRVADQLYCAGYVVDLASVNQLGTQSSGHPRILTDLPQYPFDHSQSYWHESKLSTEFRFRQHGRLNLFGAPVPDWNPLEPR